VSATPSVPTPRTASSLPGTESTKALTLLQQALPAQSGGERLGGLATARGVHDTAVQQRMTSTLDKSRTALGRLGDQSVQLARARQISRTAPSPTRRSPSTRGPEARQAGRAAGVDTAEAARTSGSRSNWRQPDQQAGADTTGQQRDHRVVAAAVVCSWRFGSLFAMLLPIG